MALEIQINTLLTKQYKINTIYNRDTELNFTESVPAPCFIRFLACKSLSADYNANFSENFQVDIAPPQSNVLVPLILCDLLMIFHSICQYAYLCMPRTILS